MKSSEGKRFRLINVGLSTHTFSPAIVAAAHKETAPTSTEVRMVNQSNLAAEGENIEK